MLRALIVAVLFAVASPATGEECHFASQAEAKALAERAVRLIEAVGPEVAFRRFMEPDGGFLHDDLYVFVVDFSGFLWVNGAYPDAVGGSALDARTRGGRYYVREMIELARRRGEGWVEYNFINPCTGKAMPKVSFVKRVGRFVVGVGAYGTVAT